MEHIIPIVTGLIGFLGGVLTLLQKYISYKRESEKRNDQLQQEIKDLSAPMVMNLQAVNELQELVNVIFKTTEASRFLILVATNGTKDLRKCTVVYEQHMAKDGVTTSIGASGRYVNFEFDNTYKQMLKDIEYRGPEYYKVEEMPNCDLKDIYSAEQVVASKVFFLRRTKIDDKNDRVWYCSIATHRTDGFKENDRIHIRTQIGQIQYLLKNMGD